METGGFINKEMSDRLLNKLLEVYNNRRWVRCPSCGNVFETYCKDNHYCYKCKYEGVCETVIQTI